MQTNSKKAASEKRSNNKEDALTQEERELQSLQLDNTDEDGEPLNEKSLADDMTGEDLDIPGAELDDEDEAIGEEDEENNLYSQPDN